MFVLLQMIGNVGYTCSLSFFLCGPQCNVQIWLVYPFTQRPLLRNLPRYGSFEGVTNVAMQAKAVLRSIY